MLIELAFICVYGAFMHVQPARPRWTASPSWGRKQVVLHQIGDAVAPGFIRVAANVDAVDERQFPGRHVGHVDVDVEDEVRDLLDHDPCGGIGAERVAVAELAAAAGAKGNGSDDEQRGKSPCGEREATTREQSTASVGRNSSRLLGFA